MKLDVKNLTFGAVGETDNFDFNFNNHEVAEDLIATSLKGKIKLTRLDDSILMELKGVASLKEECDRCLTEFELELPLSFSQEFFLGGFRENEDDLLISKNFEIDISEPLRDQIVLSIPVQKLCQKKCLGLCDHCGNDLNKDKCKCGK